MTMLDRIQAHLVTSTSSAAIAVAVGGIAGLRVERDGMRSHLQFASGSNEPETVFGFPVVEDPVLAPGTFEIRSGSR
jgi:hypothetical protein